jgi:lactoylglutathione lyase
MTATRGDPLAALAAGLEADLPSVTAELTRFPSGGAMLDVRRSDGRLFVLSFTPAHGYGVDEVGMDDGFVSGYRFAYPDLDPASQKLRELVADYSSTLPRPPSALNLVVVQARDLEAARRFYSCIGLTFRREQHGRGPEHLAAQVGPTIFEVYPCLESSAGGGVRIGFEVDSLQPTLDALRHQSVKVLTEPRDSPWGLRAVVEDPDGNRVELTQRR